MLPTPAPAGAATASVGGGRAKRVIDVPFFSTDKKAESNGAAHGGEAERKRRQARKKR
jgi:hypothetical protein